MEKDNEINVTGGSYDFGARIYDSRLGRWLSLDPQAAKQPDSSPFKSFNNNPIIFVDPEGETEFYYNGRWFGTDGVDNNVVGKVTDNKVKRDIKKSTRKGLNYNIQSITKASEFKNGILLINKDVLDYSNSMLKLSLGKDGLTGEYENVLKQEGNHFTPMKTISYNEGARAPTTIKTGDVSIHSHPTGFDKSGEFSEANKPSPDKPNDPGDESAFKGFEINIIVGLNGPLYYNVNEFGGKVFNESKRYDAINIFGKDYKNQIGEITGVEADKMLKGDRGRLGKKFEKK